MAREMKDSGIEWIGEIPKGWRVNTAFQVFVQVKNKNIDLQEKNLLSLSYGRIKKKSIDTVGGLLPQNFEGYNIVEEGDIVLRLTDLQNDQKSLRVGIVTERGIVTSAYCTIRDKDMSNRKYLYYYLHSFDIAKGFYGMGAGVRQSLNWDGLKWLKIIMPSFNEQHGIVTFLDEKCVELDNIFEKTRASIEEYKKLKQAVITQAVTKGIRGDREMKDSENKWVREIPSDIKISRVGLHYEIILGKMLCTNQIDATYTYEPYFCAADIHFGGIAESERKKMWFSPLEKQQYLVRKDDLLVVEGGAGAGGCTVASMQEVPTYIQNSIMIVRPRKSADVRYLKYLIECLVKQGYIDVVCNKATIPHFTKDKLANVPFLLFSLQEQKEIAQYLDKKCSEIDAIISYKENYIMEIENYKKSLIYEYVTGKREVPQKYQV